MKYYLSLCCIIKNEKYIEEFIIYHHLAGVEHFYIYDNDSDYPLRDRLNSFYYKKICTIIDFPGIGKQMPAYKHCINTYRDETKWLIIIDGDEFVLPKSNFNSIRDFLNNYEDYHAIGINWILFGSSFHDSVQNGFQTNIYRYCGQTQNDHIKSIVQPKYVYDVDHPHFVKLHDPSKYVDPKKNIISGPFNRNYTTDLIQINHYHFRSKEDNINKHNRGNADNTQRVSINPNHHEACNDIIDNFLPNKYLESIEKTFNKTGTNGEIYKALNDDLHFDTMDEYYEHLYKTMLIEDRPCHITDKFPNFNREIYRNNYDDLKNLDDLHIELHYIYDGFNQNRICDIII